MANEKSIVKALCADRETTFSTVDSGAYSAYTRIPMEDGKWEPGEDYFERLVQTNALGVKHAGVIGGKGGKLTFKVGAPGLSVAAASTVTAVANPAISEIIRSCGWSETLDTGTVVTGAGSTTTVIDVTSAAAITVGSMVMINGEARVVTARDTAATPDNITVSPALSTTPAAAVVVYGAANYVLSDADPGTVGFVWKADGFAYRLKGCKGTMKVPDTNARDRVILEFEFMVDTWDNTEPSGTFPTIAPVDNIIALAGTCNLATTATPTALVGFDPGMTLQPRLSTTGTNGRAGWAIADAKPMVKLRPYFSTSFRTDFEARTERELVAQFGSTATRAMAVHATKAQITAYPGETDSNGVVAHDLALALNDSQSSTVTASCRLAFF